MEVFQSEGEVKGPVEWGRASPPGATPSQHSKRWTWAFSPQVFWELHGSSGPQVTGMPWPSGCCYPTPSF